MCVFLVVVVDGVPGTCNWGQICYLCSWMLSVVLTLVWVCVIVVLMAVGCKRWVGVWCGACLGRGVGLCTPTTITRM